MEDTSCYLSRCRGSQFQTLLCKYPRGRGLQARPKACNEIAPLTIMFNMQPAPARCPERDILEARYHADVKVYLDAAKRLASCSPGDFKQVHEDAEGARVAFENARTALNNHIAAHGCG